MGGRAKPLKISSFTETSIHLPIYAHIKPLFARLLNASRYEFFLAPPDLIPGYASAAVFSSSKSFSYSHNQNNVRAQLIYLRKRAQRLTAYRYKIENGTIAAYLKKNIILFSKSLAGERYQTSERPLFQRFY